ncbi:hypothetical protein IWZ03DRAFT_5295 [Phyllosticta citriasiana]|uniref:Uncharacterized protein n=1 Tax=Phyllosticta citriasiana TaxID=595635 RepID=A0ABR1KXB2_9PEZI
MPVNRQLQKSCQSPAIFRGRMPHVRPCHDGCCERAEKKKKKKKNPPDHSCTGLRCRCDLPATNYQANSLHNTTTSHPIRSPSFPKQSPPTPTAAHGTVQHDPSRSSSRALKQATSRAYRMRQLRKWDGGALGLGFGADLNRYFTERVEEGMDRRLGRRELGCLPACRERQHGADEQGNENWSLILSTQAHARQRFNGCVLGRGRRDSEVLVA